MFNTLLQKRADINIHLNTPTSHTEQQDVMNAGNVQIVYAELFDTAKLAREQGYRAIARSTGKYNEMVIATAANSGIKTLGDVKAGATIGMADNRDVKMIGLRLLKTADLKDEDLKWETTENYQATARQVIKGEAQAGFFLAEIFHSLSRLTKTQLSVLIERDLAAISHVLLVKDDFAKAIA